jgi:hypothetical protein
LSEDGKPVWAGEELDYEIRWNGVPAGRAQLRVRRKEPFPEPAGPETWLVRLDIRSSRMVSLFYPVRTKVQAHLDVKAGFSRNFSKDQNEGDYTARERIRCDYALDKLEAHCEFPQPYLAAVDLAGEKRVPWKVLNIPLSGKVLDPLGAAYYLRGLSLRPGQTLVLPICAERRVWNTRVQVLARETRDVPSVGPQQPCLVLAPECAFNGFFEHRGPVKLWVHEATKVVVRLEAETPLGNCAVWLDRHRYSPFDRPQVALPGPSAPPAPGP